MSEVPIFSYVDDKGREKTGEVLVGKPEDVWIQLVQECKTEKELKELEEHVNLFKLGPEGHKNYYVILTNVQPEGEDLYLPRFGANRTPMDQNIFRLRVAAAKELAKLPKMFTDDSSDVFEIPD